MTLPERAPAPGSLPADKGASPQRRDLVIGLGVALLGCALALPGLDTNPAVSYDEGYVLQAPANLVRHGFYGTIDAEWRWAFDPHVTTGPPFTLPVAAVFAAAGVGIAQARLVTALYAGLATLAAYGLARHQAGPWAAAAAAALLALSLYPHSRTALGETPALALALAGAWLWLRALGSVRAWPLVFAGLVLGLAALTKLTILPVVATALGLTWAAGRLRPEPLPWRALGAPLAGIALPLAAWYALQAVVLGPSAALERLAALGEYRQQMLDLGARVAANLWRLPEAVPPALLPWAAPTLLGGAVMVARHRSRPAVVLPWALLAGATGFYLASVGWPRYGFWAAATLALLVGLTVPRMAALAGGNGRFAVALAAAVMLAPAAVWAALQAGARTAEADAVAALLREQSAGAPVGTTEWELDLLLGQVLRHPPTLVATADQEQVDRAFDWSWPGVDWVVVGQVGKALQADRKLESDARFVERLRTPNYRLFQRYGGPPPGWTWSTEGATAAPLDRLPVGQQFTAPYQVLTEVRVLLAGNGSRRNANVRLALYQWPGLGAPLAQAELDGATVVENRWYGFPMPAVPLQKGGAYYLELTSAPVAGQTVASAWYQAGADLDPQGAWYLGRQRQQGDLYYGVLGFDRGSTAR